MRNDAHSMKRLPEDVYHTSQSWQQLFSDYSGAADKADNVFVATQKILMMMCICLDGQGYSEGRSESDGSVLISAASLLTLVKPMAFFECVIEHYISTENSEHQKAIKDILDGLPGISLNELVLAKRSGFPLSIPRTALEHSQYLLMSIESAILAYLKSL
jgi:hypothetical protein